MESYYIPIFQTVATTALTSGIFYWLQRQHRINDEFIIEKNKLLVLKFIESENEIFEIFKVVKSQYFISSTNLINFSNDINYKRMENYLYISDGINKISSEFADYLLTVSIDQYERNVNTENLLFKKFKMEFKK